MSKLRRFHDQPAEPTHMTPSMDADGTDDVFTMQEGAGMFALASAVLSRPADQSSPEAGCRAHAALEELLDAARAGGFVEADELDARMLVGDASPRAVALALEAARCAGAIRCMTIAMRYGIRP